MARAGLHADLAQAGEVAPFLERAFVALHVGVEFFRRVLFTHLADPPPRLMVTPAGSTSGCTA